jgi:outer membrane protein W
MKTQLKVIALSVLVATSTYAEENKGMYFGLGMVQTKFSDHDEGEPFDYKKNNWKALIGTRLNSNWSIEGQYTNFSKDENEVLLDATNTLVMGGMAGKSIGVAGLYHFNPQGNYSPFVKLGWHYWDFKKTIRGDSGSDSADGNDAFFGVGVDGKINETIKYRVEFERVKTGDFDIDNIGASLLFGF